MLVRGAVRCGCGGLKNCSAVAETLRSESMVAVSAARAGVINALDGSGAPFRPDALAVVCTRGSPAASCRGTNTTRKASSSL